MKKKSDKFNSSLLINDQILRSAKEMSYYFKLFHKCCCKNKQKYCQVKKTHLPHFGPENNNTIFLSPILTEDIEGLISSMKKTTEVVQTVSQPKS